MKKRVLEKNKLEEPGPVFLLWKCQGFCGETYEIESSLNDRENEENNFICEECASKVVCCYCLSNDGDDDNSFLICDGCLKYGAHLSCAEMECVPKEEWFCTSCLKTRFKSIYDDVKRKGIQLTQHSKEIVNLIALNNPPDFEQMFTIVESTFFSVSTKEEDCVNRKVWTYFFDPSRKKLNDPDFSTSHWYKGLSKAIVMILNGIYMKSKRSLSLVKSMTSWMFKVTSNTYVRSYILRYNNETWLKKTVDVIRPTPIRVVASETSAFEEPGKTEPEKLTELDKVTETAEPVVIECEILEKPNDLDVILKERCKKIFERFKEMCKEDLVIISEIDKTISTLREREAEVTRNLKDADTFKLCMAELAAEKTSLVLHRREAFETKKNNRMKFITSSVHDLKKELSDKVDLVMKTLLNSEREKK